jgi:hypothetical protein
MNHTLSAVCVLLLASAAGAAAPAPAAAAPHTDAALAERIINAEVDARQRELETRLKVLESQSPQVQAEFAVMMEELDTNKGKVQPGTATSAPQPTR